jgi:cytochrome c-type biogenesis protein CcmH
MRRVTHTIGLLGAGWLALAITTAVAFSPDEPLPDQAQEARAQALHEELRCMVCQGQSIADSNAELARDMRVIVREHIAAGETDEQVVGFLTDRYGDYVLLNPPVKPSTYALWFGPVAVFVVGVAVLYAMFRRRASSRAARETAAAAAPLSADERRRLDALLDEDA